MNTIVQDAFRASNWLSICAQTEAHAAGMARTCRYLRSREMINQITSKLVRIPVPVTDEQMDIRRQQSWAVSLIIAHVCHADSMANSAPTTSADILGEADLFCRDELPTCETGFAELQQRLAGSGLRISSLAHTDAVRRTVR